MKVVEMLSNERGNYYPSLKEAFEAGGNFCVTSCYEVGNIQEEIEAAAIEASAFIPCCACGRNVMNFPVVGWASIITDDELEQPIRIKGYRLCEPCCEQAIIEDKEAGEVPLSPYIDKLTQVWHNGNTTVAANWGVFRRDF